MAFIFLGVATTFFICFYVRKFCIQNFRIPKIVWIYWDSDKPLLIKQIEENTHKKLSSWDVRYLDKDSVSQYISDFPEKFYSLNKMHQSDWIRLKLLDLYGGCWIDAGIIINDGLAIDRIHIKSAKAKSQLTVFKSCSGHFTTASGLSIPLAIDNFFIMAPQSSRVIKLWLSEFEKAISIEFLNYKIKAFSDGIDLSNIYFKSEDDVYLTQHICIERVLQEMTDYPPMIIMNSGYFMYKIQLDCNWDDELTHKKILNDPNTKKIPYIKLIKRNREGLDLTSYFNLAETKKVKISRILRHQWFTLRNICNWSAYKFNNESMLD